MRCWYTRWQMSSALDRGELASRMDRGHAARCASCQAFGRALASLDAQLSREAHAAAAPLPVARRARSPWLVAAPLAAGAAAAIVIAVSSGGGSDGPIAGSPAPPPTLLRAGGLAAGISRLLESTPLETELDNLIDDGRRGLDAVLATGGIRRRQ